jgi:class 3 adenylate cyclase
LLIRKYTEKNREAVATYNQTLDSIMNSTKYNTPNTGYIVFTDLVNSTAKINLLGDNNYYQNVLLKHNEILQKTIKNNNGRIIKNIGDSYLAVFGDHVNAVKACVESQLEFETINRERDPDDKISVRMALHTGEYTLKLVENDNIDIYGSSINYAARMIACAGGGQIVVSKALIDDWTENDIDKIAYLNLKWCEQNHLVKRNDINHFKKIYQLKKWFYKNVSVNQVGMFRFKGFDKEQELFCLSFSGDIDSIKHIDKMVNAAIRFSINEDKLRKREWDYLWDNMGNLTEKICDKMDDEKLKIVLNRLDKNNIASVVNFLKKSKRKKIIKSVSGDDFEIIKFIQKRGCGATSDIYISWFKEIINVSKEVDGGLVDEILSQLKTEDREKIEKYLSGGKVLGPVKNKADV